MKFLDSALPVAVTVLVVLFAVYCFQMSFYLPNDSPPPSASAQNFYTEALTMPSNRIISFAYAHGPEAYEVCRSEDSIYFYIPAQFIRIWSRDSLPNEILIELALHQHQTSD